MQADNTTTHAHKTTHVTQMPVVTGASSLIDESIGSDALLSCSVAMLYGWVGGACKIAWTSWATAVNANSNCSCLAHRQTYKYIHT